MSQYRSELLGWFETGRIASGREEEALRSAGMLPSATDWRTFLSHFTLWLGTIALSAAVIFFFAFNWDDLGRFAKFGLVEAAMVAGLGASWWLGVDSPPGKAVLLLLSLLAGGLLALSGQTYQTGADTYELFAWWAALIFPWVLVGRFSPLWLFWLGLLNTAVFLYPQLSSETEPMLWTLFGLNSLALIAWEAGHGRAPWLRDSWPPRLIAIASGLMATGLAIHAITDSEAGGMRGLAALAYLGWLGAIYVWYRHLRADLFMLAGAWLSLIVAVTVLLVDVMHFGDAGGFLFIGLVVIGMAAGGARVLKSIAAEQPA
jgi:uncharacterized membrane protein